MGMIWIFGSWSHVLSRLFAELWRRGIGPILIHAGMVRSNGGVQQYSTRNSFLVLMIYTIILLVAPSQPP